MNDPVNDAVSRAGNTAANQYWDEWKVGALGAGVSAELAQLGADVLRSHRKNRWGSEFLGREDDGPQMLEMCLSEPAEAEMLFVENLYPYDTSLIASTKARLGLA